MLTVARRILSPEDAERIAESVLAGEFVDGTITAGASMVDVKKNLQLVRGSALATTAGQAVLRALLANEEVRRAARPKAVLPPTFARYDAGMRYDTHLDHAIMADRDRIRTDLSVTVFLSDPESYDGGDLVIDLENGPVRIRGEKGDAVLYSSGQIHCVEPVTRGCRVVAVTWIQSFVRSGEKRRILSDLAAALDRLPPQSEEALLVRKSHDNLLRLWAEV